MSRMAPSLVKLCARTVVANLRYVGDVSGIDLHLLKDILPHCTVDQLTHIENSTQEVDLSPVTNDLWKRFYEQEFGEESMKLVIRRMKQKQVVFKWRKLYEAKKKEREVFLNKSSEKLRKRYEEVNASRMPFIGDNIPLIVGTSEEFDSIVMRLEGGETSIVAEYSPPENSPLLLAAAEIAEEPSGPDPKGKRKLKEKDVEEDKKGKKKPSKQSHFDEEIPKKAILNIDIDNEFTKGVEARSMEDLSVYVGKWVENLFEGVARIDVSTQSIFAKIDNESKEASKERDLFEEARTIDSAKITEQEKRISDLEEQLALLKEEQKSLITKNAEEIVKIRRDAEKRISQTEKKTAEKIDLMRMRNVDEIELKRKMSDDLREDYRRRCKEDLAFEKSKVNHVINEMRETHKKEIDQAKIDAVKEFTEDDDFVNYFRTMHQNTVDDVLNIMKRLGDIPSDYDHGILFSQLPKPNAD